MTFNNDITDRTLAVSPTTSSQMTTNGANPKYTLTLLDVLNGAAWLDIKSNRLAREGLDENLHIYLSNIS